jgi:hypothetical protein
MGENKMKTKTIQVKRIKRKIRPLIASLLFLYISLISLSNVLYFDYIDNVFYFSLNIFVFVIVLPVSLLFLQLYFDEDNKYVIWQNVEIRE